MKIFNSLSREIEEFKPLESGIVKLYTCGPTVYDYAHIGNFRTYIFEDILKRTLIAEGFSVKHIMNLTDVDDKTIKQSGGNKTEFSAITKKFENAFKSDLEKLNVLPPNKYTRATEYIEQMVVMVKNLLDKGFAYKAEDGSIYFSISKFSNYGKLSNLNQEGIKPGARVNQDEYEKENPADFVLWKAWDESDGDIFWITELGKGRPGWHIECSAMSQAELGDSIDIHAGAVDLIFPHHENEIAQSEAASGKKFVNFWIHGEHLLVDGKKMSKSLNNFYKLSDLLEKGFSPLDFRYLCLGAHYRDKLNFTWESLGAAKNSLARARRIVSTIDEDGKIDDKYINNFREALNDDLNTPKALSIMWNLLRDNNTPAGNKKATALEMDEIFALDLNLDEEIVLDNTVQILITQRDRARQEKDYQKSDELRGEIEKLGYKVEDSESGTKVFPKK